MASLPSTMPVGLEAREDEGLHELLERHAVLQADRDRDGEVVHQRAEGGAFLVHVDEDLAEAAVLVLAGPQIDLVAADDRLLRVALAAVGQAAALDAGLDLDDALDDPLHDALGDHGHALGERLVHEIRDRILVVGVVQQGRLQRLRQLGAVAVERVGLEAEAPGQHVGVLAVLDRGGVRHVDGLGDRAGDERLRRRHHADVALDREEALADAAARIGAVEDRQVLLAQERRAFERHGAAAVGVGVLDLLLGEAQRRQQVEAGVAELRLGEVRERSGRTPRRVSSG